MGRIEVALQAPQDEADHSGLLQEHHLFRQRIMRGDNVAKARQFRASH